MFFHIYNSDDEKTYLGVGYLVTGYSDEYSSIGVFYIQNRLVEIQTQQYVLNNENIEKNTLERTLAEYISCPEWDDAIRFCNPNMIRSIQLIKKEN